MTWPDGSKQPSDAVINESDPLIWGEYSLLHQKRLRDTGPVNILLHLWGEKGDFFDKDRSFLDVSSAAAPRLLAAALF